MIKYLTACPDPGQSDIVKDCIFLNKIYSNTKYIYCCQPNKEWDLDMFIPSFIISLEHTMFIYKLTAEYSVRQKNLTLLSYTLD